MIKVGVTGGIGSGKSHVCGIFIRLNIPVYFADSEAKIISNHDPEIRKELTALLGTSIYTIEGLNRPLLAEIIFRDSAMLQKINSIIHPKVALHFDRWCEKNSNVPYIIQESAILFESNAYKKFNKIITVFTPEEIRVQRLLQRENMTREKILAIMHNQISEQEKIQRADFTVINDETKLVLTQILSIHQKLLEL